MTQNHLSNAVAERATSIFRLRPEGKPGSGMCPVCQRIVYAWDDAVHHAKACYGDETQRQP